MFFVHYKNSEDLREQEQERSALQYVRVGDLKGSDPDIGYVNGQGGHLDQSLS